MISKAHGGTARPGLRPDFQVGSSFAETSQSHQEADVRGQLPIDSALPARRRTLQASTFLSMQPHSPGQPVRTSPGRFSRGGSLLPRQRGRVWVVPGMVAMAVARPRGGSGVCCAGWLWGLPLSPCCRSSGQAGLAALCSETITSQVGWSWADRIGIPSRAWAGGSRASAPL